MKITVKVLIFQWILVTPCAINGDDGFTLHIIFSSIRNVQNPVQIILVSLKANGGQTLLHLRDKSTAA